MMRQEEVILFSWWAFRSWAVLVFFLCTSCLPLCHYGERGLLSGPWVAVGRGVVFYHGILPGSSRASHAFYPCPIGRSLLFLVPPLLQYPCGPPGRMKSQVSWGPDWSHKIDSKVWPMQVLITLWKTNASEKKIQTRGPKNRTGRSTFFSLICSSYQPGHRNGLGQSVMEGLVWTGAALIPQAPGQPPGRGWGEGLS